ncbi:hypothetical protein [Streptomyces deccanensis]|uniref:hypothetical protein n=1 Tax=Streptomyces deccanensis TaxID=424188 RepID=UPI001EFB605F|nr:hypothetical protein [Streptomyces deccanensis]ULR51689.1 hypothetical protein L3078_21570 [Streptomyces deccanensis]
MNGTIDEPERAGAGRENGVNGGEGNGVYGGGSGLKGVYGVYGGRGIGVYGGER